MICCTQASHFSLAKGSPVPIAHSTAPPFYELHKLPYLSFSGVSCRGNGMRILMPSWKIGMDIGIARLFSASLFSSMRWPLKISSITWFNKLTSLAETNSLARGGRTRTKRKMASIHRSTGAAGQVLSLAAQQAELWGFYCKFDELGYEQKSVKKASRQMTLGSRSAVGVSAWRSRETLPR